MTLNQKQINLIYGSVLFLCFLPFVSPAIALAIGIILSLSGIKHASISKYTSFSLQASIVLMGFGMNLAQVISASKTGFIDTAISVVFVMVSGYSRNCHLRWKCNCSSRTGAECQEFSDFIFACSHLHPECHCTGHIPYAGTLF